MPEGNELDQWRAVAREQGGVGAFLERHDLPMDEEIDRPMLEPLILRIEPETEGLISLRLYDIAGNQQIGLVAYGDDLDLARKELDGL